IVAGSSTAWWYFDLRDVQSTDDAYVKGNQIAISSLVAGSVISVNYTDTDLVRQGDVLVTLDDTDARINFNKAANNLANTVRKIKQMYIADDQYNANVQEAKIAYQQALADYQRRSRLQGAAAISRENMQHAKDAVDSSKAALDVAVQAYRGNPEYGVRKTAGSVNGGGIHAGSLGCASANQSAQPGHGVSCTTQCTSRGNYRLRPGADVNHTCRAGLD
ncbi:biotin/lipoyl-binding protein, partial [Klebsiella pneumoniae]|uniref:biotin/lipoyl-binding protein n=1 Tax=Klebsiella pneumoniae TaxID=573 RepID=UPI001EFA144B